MTKEPIVIDDVDVAECENLYTTNLPIGNDKIKCGLHQGIGKTCNDYPNCYYKQLKRKEQECEELKDEIVNRNEKIEELRFSVSDLANRLCDLNAEKSFRIVDLEQTITEIKEIAEEILIECNHCDQYSCSGCPDENKDELAEQILQKVNEVLDANIQS